MLSPADELRHPHDEDPVWRESVYFNFNDPVNGIGAWIYLWVVPNQPQPSGMLVSLYRGHWPELGINDRAMANHGHRIVDGDRWIYCYKRDVEHLIEADFDDVELEGLRLRRTHDLHRYELSFDDGEGTSFDLTARFTTPPFDYAAGVNACPGWIAANRYHRAWAGSGTVTVGGQTMEIDVRGDSDHSWGPRDSSVFAQHRFKMWSFQTRDGDLAVSAVQLEDAEQTQRFDLGFVDRDGKLASIRSIESTADYDENGVQHDVDVTIVDELDRKVTATMPRMHSHLGSGAPDRLWGWEGVGTYQIHGSGDVPGLVSYFWPASIDAGDLTETA